MEELVNGNDSLRVKEEYRKIDLKTVVPEAKLQSKFVSASSLFQATNYTSSFKDVLDYVWIENNSDDDDNDVDFEWKDDGSFDFNSSSDSNSNEIVMNDNSINSGGIGGGGINSGSVSEIHYNSNNTQGHELKARTAPFPTEPQLSEHIAIPSKHYPSDHLSILVDIYF